VETFRDASWMRGVVVSSSEEDGGPPRDGHRSFSDEIEEDDEPPSIDGRESPLALCLAKRLNKGAAARETCPRYVCRLGRDGGASYRANGQAAAQLA